MKNTPLITRPLFLVGFMGSGKSTLGHQLSKHFQVPFVDLDKLIEKESGLSITQLFEEKGEAYFRKLEMDLITRQVHPVVVACGGGAACFHDNMRRMNEMGLTLWLDVTPETIMERLSREKTHRPLIADKNSFQMWQFISRLMKDRLPFYEMAQIHFKPESEGIEAVKEEVLERVKAFQT